MRRILPDNAAIFATEVTAAPSDADNIIFMYLVLPFGFTGSRDIFGRVMKSAGRYRQNRRPSYPLQNGTDRCKRKIFVDDGMFSEPQVENRATQCVECWAEGDRLYLGETATSTKNYHRMGGGSPICCC